MNNMMQMFMNAMQSNNPIAQQTQKMIEGKSLPEIKQTVLNVAKQKGIDENQLKQMAQQFGIKL